ncbi:MAG: glycosyltransferase [Eubacteriales bacterium]|nr:glycosyltransferase [Eubacteriales bacterium]
MKIVMVWNSLNHLMLPFCKALLRRGVDLSFISTSPLLEQRIRLGFSDLNHSESFVVNAYESRQEAEKAEALCRCCDILILNGVRARYRRKTRPGCLVFVFSERLFKDRAFSLKNALRYCKFFPTWFHSLHANLLCASAYAARDYRLLGQFVGHAYRWGYFAEVKPHDPQALLAGKEPRSILWAGRFLSWKHPEVAIDMAERLRRDGISFTLSIIGDGEMREALEALVAQKQLSSCVHIFGPLPPEQVRAHMERSQIYLFTSDRGEGWGGVLNESMNSACIVLANDEIGAVPYMIDDGVNGFTYPHGDTDALYRRLKAVITDPDAFRSLALAANETMQQTWNADNAAERFLALAAALSEGRDTPFSDGICSRA